MTLIACTVSKNIPFIIGDIMISTKEVDESIQLPTSNYDINKYINNKNSFPICLFQKVYIINKNVCIALAGNVLEMRDFLREFIVQCSYYDEEKISKENIESALVNCNLEEGFSKSAFLIMLIQKVNKEIVKPIQCWYPSKSWKHMQGGIFDETFACGTGAEKFLHEIQTRNTIGMKPGMDDIGQVISLNCNFIARFLAVENVTLHTVGSLWGAGFETVFYNGDSFIKIDNIAYLINVGHFNDMGDIGIPIPKLINYYRYYKGDLLISSIEINNYELQQIEDSIIILSTDFNAKHFIVPRIDLNVSIEELPKDLSFTTNRIAMGYGLIKNNETVLTPSFYSDKNNNIQVKYKDNESIKLTISIEMNDVIRTSSKDIYSRL